MSRCRLQFNHLIVILGVLLIINLFIFDMVALSVYSSVWNKLNSVHFKKGWTSHQFFKQNEELRDFVAAGKNGGFVSAIEQTLGRVFSVSHSIPSEDKDSPERTVSFLGLDVSHSGEVTYIYRRILSRRSFPFARLVVDIGANDGFLSSNSFNFIQLGWDAVLVEPLESQLALAKKNGKRFVDPYGDKTQKVQYVQAAMGETDGFVTFVLSDDVSNMQNQIEDTREDHSEARATGAKVQIKALSVKTLAEQYGIPPRFAVLSVDAEGVGDKVLHQWIDLGYRPAYIIYESMYNAEPVVDTNQYLAKNGYRHLTKRGWNHIYELQQQNDTIKTNSI